VKTSIAVNFKNEAPQEPAEIRIYSQIGKDPWEEEGFDADDFANALASIPKNRALVVRINSPGGRVSDGQAIKTMFDQWPANKTTMIDGVAASTASWCFMGANEVVMAPHAQMFIHDAHAICMGNAADMLKAAKDLDKTSDLIADIYANKTGKSRKAMRDMMREGSLLTGEECKSLGLVDKLSDTAPVSNFSSEAVSAMRNRINDWKTAINNSATQLAGTGNNNKHIMNKQEMLALLNKWGVTVKADATDEEIKNLVSAGKPDKSPETPKIENKGDDKIISLENQIKSLTEANNAAKKSRITSEVQALIDNDQVPANQKESHINRLVKMSDEDATAYMNDLRALPSKPPGSEPINFDLRADASPKDVVRGFANFGEPMKAWQRGNSVNMKDISDAALARGVFLAKNLNAILPMMNTNTIATELKRSVILGVSIRDFVRKLLMLNQFSTVFSNVPLEGTDKVEVPFYDLDSSASTSFVSGTGYTTTTDTVTDKREIQIGEAVQGANVNRDRKYTALSFTSQEIARQPYLKIQQLTTLKLEKLASDIVSHVLGIVVNANYGAPAVTRAFNAFASDDLADLVGACKTWPYEGRSLFLDTQYHVSLLKDSSFKAAYAANSDVAIKEGKLFPKVYGFDYIENPTIATSGSENLGGFAVFQSAILFATAPVPPIQEVRNAGTQYEIIVEPSSGIALEYRSFGNNVTDSAIHLGELSYGFAKGNANALKRIVTA
jgi:ATP-dependent protease ClpP protease subunit